MSIHQFPSSQAKWHIGPCRPSPDTGARKSGIAAERIIYRNRVARIQRVVGLCCVGLVIAVLAYFGGQFARVML